MDVHGQRESHSLLEPSYQIQLLDAFGKLGDLRAAYDESAGPASGNCAAGGPTCSRSRRPGSGN